MSGVQVAAVIRMRYAFRAKVHTLVRAAPGSIPPITVPIDTQEST